jgi:hypothetical protein
LVVFFCLVCFCFVFFVCFCVGWWGWRVCSRMLGLGCFRILEGWNGKRLKD